ncbi:MAG: hypothetical protein P4L31_07140, partial [Candidatus Babeliales bacterium]|nr:hypothetical protein [Candidatus Babeliales bacterium]
MHKISFIYISLILYCPLSSPGAAPAHAHATTIILTKKNPPTYLELDRLLYAKEDENDITACSILNEIKNQYHLFDFSLSKCALKKCTIKQIKALGIAQLTKYALSKKFCDLCMASKNFWSFSTTNHKKIKACITDPLFDVNNPTIDGILPLHHSPRYPLELLYTDVTALDAQGNSVLHIYCHTGDIRPLLHSQYRAHIKKII